MKAKSNCNFSTSLFYLSLLVLCQICQSEPTGGKDDEYFFLASSSSPSPSWEKIDKSDHPSHHDQKQLGDEIGSFLSNRWRIASMDSEPRDESEGPAESPEEEEAKKDAEKVNKDGQMKYFYPSVPRSQLPNFRPSASIEEKDDLEKSKSSIIPAGSNEKQEIAGSKINTFFLPPAKDGSGEEEKRPQIQRTRASENTQWNWAHLKGAGEKRQNIDALDPSSKKDIFNFHWADNGRGEEEDEKRQSQVTTSIRITSKKESNLNPWSPSAAKIKNDESNLNEKREERPHQVYFDDALSESSSSGQKTFRLNWTHDEIAFVPPARQRHTQSKSVPVSIVKENTPDKLSLAPASNNNNNNNNSLLQNVPVKGPSNNWKPVDKSSNLHRLDEEGSSNLYTAAAAPNLFDPYLTAHHSPASPSVTLQSPPSVHSPSLTYGQQAIPLQSPPTALAAPYPQSLPLQSPLQVHTVPLAPLPVTISGQPLLNDPSRHQVQQSPTNVHQQSPPLATPPVQVNVIRQDSPPAPATTVLVNEPRIDLVKLHAPPPLVQSPPIVHAVPHHVHAVPHHVHHHHQVHQVHQVHHAPPPPTTTLVHHPPAVVHPPPAVINHPPTIVQRPPTIVYSPPALVSRPPTVIHSQPVVPLARAVPVAPIALRAYAPPVVHAAPIVHAAPVVHAPNVLHTPVHHLVAHAPRPCPSPALPVVAAPPVHFHAPIVHPVVPVARAASLVVPAAPARSRTVYTQVQYLPEQTHVVTTTQFSPATKTTIYETDHLAAYSSHKPVVLLPPNSPGKLVPLSPPLRVAPQEHATIYTFPSLVKNRIVGAPIRLTDRIRSRRKTRQKERIRQFEERQRHKKDKKIIFIDRIDHQKAFNATARVEEKD